MQWNNFCNGLYIIFLANCLNYYLYFLLVCTVSTCQNNVKLWTIFWKQRLPRPCTASRQVRSTKKNKNYESRENSKVVPHWFRNWCFIFVIISVKIITKSIKLEDLKLVGLSRVLEEKNQAINWNKSQFHVLTALEKYRKKLWQC